MVLTAKAGCRWGLNMNRLKKKYLRFLTGVVGSVTFTVGTEATNVINVAVQVKDENGKAIAQRVCLDVWLSDAATGAGVVATAPSGTVVIGTNGTLLDVTGAKKLFKVWTDAQGRFDINITEAGVKTEYLAVKLPDGSINVSGAVSHA